MVAEVGSPGRRTSHRACRRRARVGQSVDAIRPSRNAPAPDSKKSEADAPLNLAANDRAFR
jgi:hypothetical protein